MSYVNNYVDWDQLNELYNLHWIGKNIRSIYTVARKLKLVLTKATNYRLEIVKEERQKREEMIKKQKTKAMAVKRQKIRKELVCLVKKREIMRVTLGIKQIQTKPMINIYCHSKK